MRFPVRSETDAFRITCGLAVLIAVSAALAAVIGPLAGVALFVGAIAGALAWEFGTTDPERRRPLREAALIGRAVADEGQLILVVANRTLADEELHALLQRRADAGAELRILAPVLVSRARYLASDVDSELRQARRRLRETLAWAQDSGIRATGVVGDPNAALDAIEDELRSHAADEIIVSTLPAGRSNWLEAGILERLEDELEIPITHVVAHSLASLHEAELARSRPAAHAAELADVRPPLQVVEAEPSSVAVASAEPARVLIVANRTAATPGLIEAVRDRAAAGPCTFTLLVPHTPHGLERIVGHEDAHADVDESAMVLELALPLLADAAGTEVDGLAAGVDPLTAIQDAVNLRGYDEIILSTLPARVSRWLKLDLPSKVRGLGLPVTHVEAHARPT
jgi:hypothetical protein